MKVINFDLNVLIQNNKQFEIESMKLIVAESNKTEKECKHIINLVREDIEYKIERFGIYINCPILMLCNELDIKHYQYFKTLYEKLYIKYPPTISDEISNIILRLQKKYKVTGTYNNIFISSNIINKTTLLETVELDTLLFSDELGYSINNPLFFKNIQEYSGVLSKNIIHISSNLELDIRAGIKYGINTIQSANELPFNIENEIEHKFNKHPLDIIY